MVKMKSYMAVHEELQKKSEDIINNSNKVDNRINLVILILAVSGIIISIIGTIALLS